MASPLHPKSWANDSGFLSEIIRVTLTSFRCFKGYPVFIQPLKMLCNVSMAINCPLIQGCQWAPLWVTVPAEAGTEGKKVHPQALLILPHEFLPRKDRLLLQKLGTTRWSQLLLVKLQWPYNELQDLLTQESLAQVSFQLEESHPATSQPFGMFRCVSLSAFVLLCDRWNILCISM